MKTEMEPLPEAKDLIELTPQPFAVWVSIKKSSKYYYQGLVDGKSMKCPLDRVIFGGGEYCYQINHNSYRKEDLNFFLVSEKGEFVRL